MTATPRYLGSTVAAAVAALEETLTTDVYLRVADMANAGAIVPDSADERAVVRAICAAETAVDLELSASHGAPFQGVVPDGVVLLVALRWPWCLVRFRSLSGGENAPYKALYAESKALTAKLAADQQARFPETGASAPTHSLPPPVASGGGSFWGPRCDEGGRGR